MKPLVQFTASVLAFASIAKAHYRFTALILDGQPTKEFEYVRKFTNANSPVSNVMSTDVRCNVGSQAFAANTKVAEVRAGTEMGFLSDRIGHPGPLAIYMSKAPGDVKAYDGSGAWFKVKEMGATINGDKISWSSDGLTRTMFKIPASTPPGQYLVRAEHTALHGAGNANGAQMYIACGQIKVSGSGGGNPQPTIRLPGGYTPNDPGLKVNIYWPPLKSYSPPGPAVWQG